MDFKTNISTKISDYIDLRCLYIHILKHVCKRKKERIKFVQNKNAECKTQKNETSRERYEMLL